MSIVCRLVCSGQAVGLVTAQSSPEMTSVMLYKVGITPSGVARVAPLWEVAKKGVVRERDTKGVDSGGQLES